MVPVPNLVGKKEEEALEKLADVGLSTKESRVTYVYSNTYAKGKVVSQNVKAGVGVAFLGPLLTEYPITVPTATFLPAFTFCQQRT